MLELQKNLGLSYVLITYNLPVLKHMSDQLMVLCNGTMVEYGPTKDILENPKHPYTKDLLNMKTKVEASAIITETAASGCIYCNRCSLCSERCYTESPEQHHLNDSIVCCHNIQ